MSDDALLDGKVAFVTGGGTGIGRAIAETFAAAGASVVITGRRPEPLAAVVERIEAAGGTAMSLCVDVTDLDTMEEAARAANEHFGRLDVVVANAGSAAAFI